MNETRLCTIEQIEQFLDASAEIDFSPHDDDLHRYAHIADVLKRFGYHQRPDGHPNSPGYGHFKIPHLRDREQGCKADTVGTCLAERKPDLPRWRSWSERFEAKQANNHLYPAAAGQEPTRNRTRKRH